ncbi:ribosome maturation factor RimP [Segetibacter koreensis]|uniref:ribosome maturation factor RimP n=1 Tax=Segetibacter koreensis TaxID=398037 RepID=UPI000367638B|nr:ribosome maturation factor [Segetibacter koreensis]
MDYIYSYSYICSGNKNYEGNGYRSLLLFNMANETVIAEIEAMVNSLLASDQGDFLVSIKIKPTNNIKIFIDSDEGMSIEKCVKYNRKLYAQLEEKAIFPDGNFSLEISSPGVDEPLKMHRQYVKNKGRNLLVTFNDATEKEGKLLEVTDTDIIIEQKTGKGKKAESHQFVIPFENIKTATVQIQF